MSILKSERRSHSGKLIALEGDLDLISTQLKLLPLSRKILIVPSLQEDLGEETTKDFDAGSFVQKVHATYMQRIDKAHTFLQSSTNAHPKLVFMLGGSISARTTCITKIASQLTNGQIAAAELMFNEIVKDGVVGLTRKDPQEVKIEGDDKMSVGETIEERHGTKVEEDPTIRAMKTAETLDRETVALQTDDEIEQHLITNYEFEGEQKNAFETESKKEIPMAHVHRGRPKFRRSVFGNQGEIVKTVLTIPEKRPAFKTRTTLPALQTQVPPRIARQASPADPYDTEQGLSAEPNSPVIIGEAQIVKVASAMKNNFPRRTQSADEPRSNGRRASGHSKSESLASLKTTSHIVPQEKHQDMDERRKGAYEDYFGAPRYHFLRASQTTIRNSPTSGSAKSVSSAPPQPCRIYVDKGTDAGSITEARCGERTTESFLPVFDLVEDIVIQFSDNTSHDEIFESVIQSYKDRSYQASPERPVERTLRPADDSSSLSSTCCRQETNYIGVSSPDSGYAHERRSSFDPFAIPKYTPNISRGQDPFQLIPADTSKLSEKFLTFSPVDLGNSISIQNAFRQFLKSHFPVENGYSQYYHPTTTEADRIWKPVFRNEDSSSVGIEGMNVDQIITLGSEDGVSKDLSSQISGLIERFGIKSDGLNRSGKLDIGYLINNVMQTFSASTTRPALNPLTNPSLLASLLVPQLESYLALNSSTRLLILQYPAAHLSTVFALRELLGSDLIRIAGIVDSFASEPPSHSRTRTPILANPLSNDAVASRHAFRINSRQQSGSREPARVTVSGPSSPSSRSSTTRTTSHTPAKPSFSKADFVLPSTATDTEIASFLSSIWKCLVEKSTFYTPELEPEPKIIEKIIEKPSLPLTPPTASITLNTQRPRTKDQPPVSLSQKRENKILKLTGKGSGYTNSHSRDRSIPRSEKTYAESVMTTATERDQKWENFYIGEEDSEDDDWDRMILGRAGMRRLVPEESVRDQEGGKGVDGRIMVSKKKALKWLGLA